MSFHAERVVPSALPGPDGRQGAIVAVAMWAVAVAMFILSAAHDDFPFTYHPDEPSKVAQVITGERNYHHPPLMLALTRGVLRAGGIELRPQNVARTGRLLSACYLAAAAAGLTWLAGVYGGPGGAVCAAAALGTDAQAVLAGHFFKEDALFALGLALTFCAGAVHWRRRRAGSLLALGAAAGLAFSSKYVGALFVAYALVLAACAAKPGAVGRAAGIAAVGAVAALVLCNGAALLGSFTDFRGGLTYGLAVSREGNHAVGARVPHLRFVGMFFLFTPLPLLAGATAFWAGLRRIPFRAHADRWLAGLAPLWLLAAFSFSASTAVRYFLPISLMLDCVAGAALPGGVRWAWARWRRERTMPSWLPALTGSVVVILFNLPGLCALLDGFAGGDRAALRQWIAHGLPPSAVIAQDALAQLPDGVLTQRVLSKTCVADFGDFHSLREQGITHVVVCWYDSRRYVDHTKQPSAGASAEFARRQAFYRDLPEHAHRLWSSELRQPYPLRPGLELYALDGMP